MSTTGAEEVSTAVNSIEKAVADYVAAWNENDAEKRMRLLEGCWAVNGTVKSNTTLIEGRSALSAAIGAFRDSFPGDRGVLTSAVDHHHDCFRFTAKVVRPDGTAYSEALDVGEVDADGRIEKILTFFGPLPLPDSPLVSRD